MNVKLNFCDTTKTNDIYPKENSKDCLYKNKLKKRVEKAIK